MLNYLENTRSSLCDIDVDAEVRLPLNVGLQVGHLKVVVHPVDNEVRKPRVLARTLKQTTEQLETVLAEVVAEDLEGHEGLVLGESLCEQRQSEVIYIVVAHVDVHQTLIHSYCLRDCLNAVVGAFIVGQVEGFKAAVLALQILSDCFAAFEADLVCIQIQHLQSVILQQMLH